MNTPGHILTFNDQVENGHRRYSEMKVMMELKVLKNKQREYEEMTTAQ